MLEEITLWAKRSERLGFETTLSSQESGYEVRFVYPWVPSVELALLRSMLGASFPSGRESDGCR